MVYKRFRIQCLTRVLVLAATIFLFLFLLLNKALYATTVIVGALAVFQIYSLIRFIEKTNRNLIRFLESIRHGDFSQLFTDEGYGSSFDELNAAFDEVTGEFRRTRAEKEEYYRYLQTVVQHIGIGIIVYKKNGDVELINTASKRLLNVTHLKNVKSLEPFSSLLADTLLSIKSGDKKLVNVESNDELMQFAIYAAEFKLRSHTYTLVSIQNIHSELQEKEMDAWQNLIRVLTHEIMNSVTPIVSLASTAHELVKESNMTDFTEESLGDIENALGTIQKRSQGLLHFVDNYRNLTRIPNPEFSIFPVAELFKRVQQLMGGKIEEKGIEFITSVDPATLEMTADPDLIEQALINLVMNAIHVVGDIKGGWIKMTAFMGEQGRIVIQVADNGPGIPEDVLQKIFIPFFTTKREGSGIGLSLSRQIMRLHHGTITVRSKPDIETIFTLRF